MLENNGPHHYDLSGPDGSRADTQVDLSHSPYVETRSSRDSKMRESQLAALAELASVNIETSMVADLSGSLHSLFDDICDKTLPIYFGPLLGRLYLEGL